VVPEPLRVSPQRLTDVDYSFQGYMKTALLLDKKDNEIKRPA